MTDTDLEFSAPGLSLEELSERIEIWRKTRKHRRPMPEPLWQAAASLSHQLSIQQVSKTLGLNYGALKKRVYPQGRPAQKPSSATFIEMGFEHQSVATDECIVEMHDGGGAKMRMHFFGNTDLNIVELSKTFWAKER